MSCMSSYQRKRTDYGRRTDFTNRTCGVGALARVRPDQQVGIRRLNLRAFKQARRYRALQPGISIKSQEHDLCENCEAQPVRSIHRLHTDRHPGWISPCGPLAYGGRSVIEGGRNSCVEWWPAVPRRRRWEGLWHGLCSRIVVEPAGWSREQDGKAWGSLCRRGGI